MGRGMDRAELSSRSHKCIREQEVNASRIRSREHGVDLIVGTKESCLRGSVCQETSTRSYAPSLLLVLCSPLSHWALRKSACWVRAS